MPTRRPLKGDPYCFAVRYERQPDGTAVKIVERNTWREPENAPGNDLRTAHDWQALTYYIGRRHKRKGCLRWNGPLSPTGSPVFLLRDGRTFLAVRTVLWGHLEPGADEAKGYRPIYSPSCRDRRCVAYEHARFVADVPK